ncbi:hypothetical protein NMY22_g7156 [Coprinellus aureogranulatus]|nr:hypothetical protein NMY22_g7156 [Coprinellus aureogranulatus]
MPYLYEYLQRSRHCSLVCQIATSLTNLPATPPPSLTHDFRAQFPHLLNPRRHRRRGPSGLTLACILKAIHIPFTVFELDSSPSARTQGGMLDIHKSSGQLALGKAGLLHEFKKRMRVDATEFQIRDGKGKVYWHHTEAEEEDPERPEIDRGDLRDMLLGPLGEGDVKWGKKLVEAEKNPSDGNYYTGKLHVEQNARIPPETDILPTVRRQPVPVQQQLKLGSPVNDTGS